MVFVQHADLVSRKAKVVVLAWHRLAALAPLLCSLQSTPPYAYMHISGLPVFATDRQWLLAVCLMHAQCLD